MPERPRPDLLELAASQGLTVMWPEGDGFVETGGFAESEAA
jgi:hypothetical protein